MGAIIIVAMLGRIFSSFLTGTAIYYSTKYFTGDKSLSILDSLVFGSLISSIDPVAILSVLSSLNMSDIDIIYILVFGESLLNDGIIITLFKSLVQEYEASSAITMDNILGSIADFLINAIGSCVVGIVCGIACLCYFHLNASILHPVMEVASFFLWAVVPYWMSEALDWSGIVAIVVMGFFMDISSGGSSDGSGGGSGGGSAIL
jgi:NhaP-type Na+/H+ or K+/H+ antiporter